MIKDCAYRLIALVSIKSNQSSFCLHILYLYLYNISRKCERLIISKQRQLGFGRDIYYNLPLKSGR